MGRRSAEARAGVALLALTAGLSVACKRLPSAQLETDPSEVQTDEAEGVFVESEPTGRSHRSAEPQAVSNEEEAETESPADEQRRNQARELFAEGAEAYRTGDYAKALAAFERAFVLEPMPALAYNIAQVHEKLGDDKAACIAYRKVVALAQPDDPARAVSEARVQTLGC